MRSFGPARSRSLIVAAAVSIFAACSTAPPAPPPELALARTAIEAAHAAGADETAAAEMTNARAKLENARLLAQSANTVLAGQMAEEAEIDAHAARAKAAYARSKRSLDGVEAELGALRQRPLPTAPR